MGYYTVLHKTIICPFWKCKLTLQGKYRFSANDEHGYIARFSSAKCPLSKILICQKENVIKIYPSICFAKCIPVEH